MFEYALTLGMSVDEYWYGDPYLLYRFESKYQNQRKLKEQHMWLMGQYVARALQCVPLNVNGFIQNQSQIIDYPECPHSDPFGLERPMTKEEKELLEQARARLMARGLLDT